MQKHLALSLIALMLTACGQSPIAVPQSPTSAIEAQQNLYKFKELQPLCEYVIKNQTKAKANKTNIARIWVALDYAQGLAEKEGNTKAVKIAQAALDRHHERSIEPDKKNHLPAQLAEEMKTDLLEAFHQVLDTTYKN